MPATFGDVYETLCERYPDPRERGRQFEPLVQKVLTTDKKFRDRDTAVWRWNEWPGRDGPDNWCDIVAERADGGLTAIQCKCYDPGGRAPAGTGHRRLLVASWARLPDEP